MKKINGLLLGLGFLGAVSAMAGESVAETSSYRGKPRVGVQAGLNFDSATTPSQINASTKTGFTVGAVFDLPIGTLFSISPEINYSRRGFDLVNAGGIKASVASHSIEVPVFAKIGFGDEIRPYFFAGPMGVWNISNELTGDIGKTGKSISYDPRTFDLAAVGGVGVDIGPVFASARVNFGLIDIDNRSADWRSRGFKLIAGLKL